MPDSLQAEERKLLTKRDELNAFLHKGEAGTNADSLIRELNIVNRNLDDFQKKMEQDYTEYAALKYQDVLPIVADVQNSLQEGEALIQYVVGTSQSYLIYMDKQEMEVLNLDIEQSMLTEKVEILRKTLMDYEQDNYEEYTSTAHWFYQQLLEPVLVEKTDIEHLIIIPDNQLGHLPFETFLTEPANDQNYNELPYLLLKYQVSYNYSVRLWQENQIEKELTNNDEILGIAAHYELVYDSLLMDIRSAKDIKLRNVLSPLPEARKEVVFLSEIFDGKFLLDSNANEAAFKREAAEYAVIHLAMHGLLDNRVSNLSSLAFTENGDTIENNFLYAYEISKLNLNADLVVLSACETGYGKFERGNGVASLARSFMYAGVPAMVVSLWEVNDRSTAILMESMYKKLSEGNSKSEALRQAKIEYIKSTKGFAASPAFWSPFIQIGNNQPVNIKAKSNNLLFYILGGLGAIGVILFLLKLRQKRNA